MDFNTGVFERGGADTLSDRAFYLALGGVIVWGLGGTAVIANAVVKSGYQPDILATILLGLVMPIAGIIIGAKSDNPLVSFLGFNMVSVPFGVILAPIVNVYSPQLIQNAFQATCCVTVIMMCLAMIYPGFFSQLGGVLFSALLGLLAVRVMQMFIPSMARMRLFDWLGAGIFSLYIGYDWYRASSIPKTLDNAVDVALDLYLDIVNLFLNLLRIMGNSDD